MRLALSVYAVVVAGALAQEKPASASDASIDAAKRDFNALRAARSSIDIPLKLDLPSLTTPEMSVGASQPIPSTLKSDAALAKKKSANWLVDAMTKSADKNARDSRGNLLTSTRDDRLSSILGDRDGRELTADADSPRAAESEKLSPVASGKKNGAEFNPLKNYMAGWMTPQDYSLLKPGLDSAVSGRMANSPIEQISPGGTNDLVALDHSGAGGVDFGAAARPGAVMPAPADNPFLQSLNAPTAPPAPVAAFTPSSPSTPSGISPAALAPPSNEPPAAKSKIPDFAKPAADEKYFKQLKRF